MKWTRKRPGVYECEAGMVFRNTAWDSEWRGLLWTKNGAEPAPIGLGATLADAKATVEAHAKEAEG